MRALCSFMNYIQIMRGKKDVQVNNFVGYGHIFVAMAISVISLKIMVLVDIYIILLGIKSDKSTFQNKNKRYILMG